MLWFIVRRFVSGVILVFVITVVAFAALYINSENIARQLVGPTATQDTVARRAAELGLDRPVPVQYLDWLVNALTGNLGRSWSTGQLVSESIAARLPVTLSLVIGATIVSAIIAVVLGVLAARRGGAVDTGVQFVTVLGFAVPGFLVALFLVLVFSVNLHWFKATGFVPLTVSFSGWLASVTLPIAALSFGVIAAVSQQIRGSVIDAMSRDYVRTLRARGLGTGTVVFQHVLRNAGGPALAILAVQMIGLIGGAVVIEQIFAIPGIGQLTVQATSNRDIPVVMAIVVVTAILVVIINLLIDLAQAALNPKVRLS
ncbi:ABC transporter permease [Microbacterium sp. X-17]|uniref:ABC transporter permease n=1 Tax=Microbacterium sp. X-17 TaxID=3144404 RepID=UPI0031F50ABB